MRLAHELIHADTQWIRIEDDPSLLAEEIRRWETQKALLEADILAGDFTDDTPEQLRGGIAYADVVLRELIRQTQRLTRAELYREAKPLDQAAFKARFEAANAIDTFTLLDRLTGKWSRLGPRDEYWMCCPLEGHEDDTPSFHMNEDGRWFCFGCRRGGGDKVSFAAALLMSSQLAGLTLIEEVFGL